MPHQSPDPETFVDAGPATPGVAGEGLATPDETDLMDLADLSMSSLRTYRRSLIEEEERVSFWRRLIQVRLDLIASMKQAEQITTADLISSLGLTASGARRQQFLTVKAHEPLPSLPGLDELWTAAIDPDDEEGTRVLVQRLTEVEGQLSAYRRSVHARLDAATAELVARYKADPGLADDLFATFG